MFGIKALLGIAGSRIIFAPYPLLSMKKFVNFSGNGLPLDVNHD